MSRTSGFSRRRLLSSATGLGALIWVPRLARAADPHGHMNMSDPHEHMNMSPTLGMEPRKPPPAMDAPLIEPETRRSVNESPADDAALRLHLSRHWWRTALRAQLRGRLARSNPAHEARRDPQDPHAQRLPAQPRPDADGPEQPASVQQHELSFSRQPLGPRRHLRQRHALDGAGRDLRHRNHPAQGPHQRAPTGTTRTITAAPTSRWQAAWSAWSSSRATSPRCPRSPTPRSACWS